LKEREEKIRNLTITVDGLRADLIRQKEDDNKVYQELLERHNEKCAELQRKEEEKAELDVMFKGKPHAKIA